MKIDGNVYLSEIKFCEAIAEKLGYNKKVVKLMSSKIYKDPAISSDRIALMEQSNRYLKQ